MTHRDPQKVENWLGASIEEALVLLPLLLALPAPDLRQEFDSRPALRTAGMLHSLLRLAHEAIEDSPRRALVFTAVVIQHAPSMAVPAEAQSMRLLLEGQAWIARADALRRLGRSGRARDAVAAGRVVLEKLPARKWFDATLDLIEAPLLHDSGQRDTALETIRRAAETFEEYHDVERYAQAVMMEFSMLWTAGDRAAATRLWDEVAEAARQRGDAACTAMLEWRIGLFELEKGDPAQAVELLSSAQALLDAAGLTREAIRARHHRAEAAAACGRVSWATSELYTVHAQLVAINALRDAALVAIRILELLLGEQREAAVVRASETFVRTLRDAGMPPQALAAITWLERRARATALTPDDVRQVGRYFADSPENLDLQPRAWTPRVVAK